MHAIYVRDLGSRQPGIALAVEIEDAALAERLVRSIAGSYPKHGSEEPAGCWFRDERGLHRIWSEPAQGRGHHVESGSAFCHKPARVEPPGRSGLPWRFSLLLPSHHAR